MQLRWDIYILQQKVLLLLKHSNLIVENKAFSNFIKPSFSLQMSN